MTISLMIIRAHWDAVAAVWVATTDDVPGLVTESATLEGLRDKLVVMIPELMEANNVASDLPEIAVHIIAELGVRIPISKPRAAA